MQARAPPQVRSLSRLVEVWSWDCKEINGVIDSCPLRGDTASMLSQRVQSRERKWHFLVPTAGSKVVVPFRLSRSRCGTSEDPGETGSGIYLPTSRKLKWDSRPKGIDARQVPAAPAVRWLSP